MTSHCSGCFFNKKCWKWADKIALAARGVNFLKYVLLLCVLKVLSKTCEINIWTSHAKGKNNVNVVSPKIAILNQKKLWQQKDKDKLNESNKNV